MMSARSAYFVAKGGIAVVQAEQVRADQHLAIAVGTGADADGRNVERGGHAGREIGRNRFEHDGERAGILQSAARR